MNQNKTQSREASVITKSFPLAQFPGLVEPRPTAYHHIRWTDNAFQRIAWPSDERQFHRNGLQSLRNGLRSDNYILRSRNYTLISHNYTLISGNYTLISGNYRLRSRNYTLPPDNYTLLWHDYIRLSDDYTLLSDNSPRFSVNDLKGRLITLQERGQLGCGFEFSDRRIAAGWRAGAEGAELVAG